MLPRQWRLLAAVLVALAWLMQPAGQTASAATPNFRTIEPTSGPPGTKTVIDGNPCAFEAAEFEPTFVWFSEVNAAGEGRDVAATEVRRSDGGQPSYVFVVPDLPGGSYELSAACDISPTERHIPTTLFAEFEVIPDTATGHQPSREPPGGALLPALATIVGSLAWHWRMSRGRCSGRS